MSCVSTPPVSNVCIKCEPARTLEVNDIAATCFQLSPDHFQKQTSDNIRPFRCVGFAEMKVFAVDPEFCQKFEAAVSASLQERAEYYSQKYTENYHDAPDSTSTGDLFNQVKMLAEIIRERSATSGGSGLHNALNNLEFGIASIVGRDDVQDLLARQIYLFVQDPVGFAKSFRNFIITGPPGSGKTHLARRIAYVYNQCQIMSKFQMSTKCDFVVGYVDDAVKFMKNQMSKSLDSVHVIDDADFIFEHADVLCGITTNLDEHTGRSVAVICKEESYSTIAGAHRRFPYRIDLSTPLEEDLLKMLIHFIQQQKLQLVANEIAYLRQAFHLVFEQTPKSSLFGPVIILEMIDNIRDLALTSTENWTTASTELRISCFDQAFKTFLSQQSCSRI